MVVAVAAAASGWLIPGDPPAASLEQHARGVSERVEERLARDGVPGAAVAVVRAGEIAWVQGYGVADRHDAAPVTSETVFQAGSISKSLTAWAVLALAERGLVDLDAPIEDQLAGWQLPDSPHPTDGVTPRRLLAHTAGLPFATSGVPTSTAQLRRGDVDPALFTLEREPGARFGYSNPGYAVLALLIEDVTGRSFEGVLAGEVLEPLGMANSTFAVDEVHEPHAATGYTADGESVPADWEGPIGASGVHTTAVDLARFVTAVHDANGQPPGRGVLPPDALGELHRPHAATTGVPHALMAEASGLGHFVEHLSDSGVTAVAHGGEEEGWVGGYVVVPATGDGMVVLTNSRNGYPLMTGELAAWAQWRDLGPLHVTRSLDRLAAAARAVAGLLGASAVLLIRGILVDLRAGAHPLAPRPRPRRIRRLVALVAAGALLLAWWGLLADPVATFLPQHATWVGLTLTVCAAALVGRALLDPGARLG